jgi:hypothetical protein
MVRHEQISFLNNLKSHSYISQIFNNSFDVLAVMALAEAVSTTETALDKNYAIIEDCNTPDRLLRLCMRVAILILAQFSSDRSLRNDCKTREMRQ